MMICVNSELLGTRKHLIYQVKDGQYYWSQTVPHSSWVFGDYSTPRSLDVLFDLLGLEKPTIAVQSHVRAFKILSPSGSVDIPWHQVLPPNEFKQLILHLLAGLENALTRFISMEYMETFESKRSVLTGLSRAVIDKPLLMSYIRDEENSTVRSTLRTFLPNTDCLASPIMYNQASTVTGRLTVGSGPQILTLPKKYRNIITSRYQGGKIIQIDFTSLEPRVARLATGLSVENDVYMQLSRELFNSSLTREEVKIAVLCALYGVSRRRLSSMLGDGFNANSIIKEIRGFFGIPELVKELKNQMLVNHKITNHFGRIIEPDKTESNILINHFVQSTSVDAAILGFHSLINKLSDKEVVPLFIIHDALVLDVSPESLQGLCEVIKNGISVPTMGNFPVEISTINDSGQ